MADNMIVMANHNTPCHDTYPLNMKILFQALTLNTIYVYMYILSLASYVHTVYS